MFGVTMSIFNAFRSREMCKPPWVTHDYNYFIYDLDWFDGFFIGVKLKCSFQIPEIWFQLFYYQNGIKDKICWCTNHVSRSSDSQLIAIIFRFNAIILFHSIRFDFIILSQWYERVHSHKKCTCPFIKIDEAYRQCVYRILSLIHVYDV